MFCLCFTVKCWLLVPQVMRIWKRTLQRWNICTPLEKGKQPNRISVFLASFFLYHSRSPHLHTYYSSAMCRKSRHAKMDNFGFAKTDTLTLISFCSLSLSVRVCSVLCVLLFIASFSHFRCGADSCMNRAPGWCLYASMCIGGQIDVVQCIRS